MDKGKVKNNENLNIQNNKLIINIRKTHPQISKKGEKKVWLSK